MLAKIIKYHRHHGLSGLLNATSRRLIPPRARIRQQCVELLRGKRGLEVGGPSGVFGPYGLIPVYSEVAALDNCNFATRTAWEGSIKEGNTFRFAKNKPSGRQFVLETTDLHEIPSAAYDFFLSSHVIEHSANPIKALSEWMRVVKPGAPMLLIAPHREGTFDWQRPVTALEHMQADHVSGTGEDDQTHFDEILRLHDLRRDPEIDSREQFTQRVSDNLRNRCVHHHVFDTQAFARLLDHMNLQILNMETAKPFHIIALVQKLSSPGRPDNAKWLTQLPQQLLSDVFHTDRLSTQATPTAARATRPTARPEAA